MDSNYYDEERMQDEINDALNNESSNEFYDFTNNYTIPSHNGLTDQELESKLKGLNPITLEEFKSLNPVCEFTNVKYLGWSSFFKDRIKIHLSIGEKYYVFCVVREKALKSILDDIDKEIEYTVEYHGIRQNYKGEDYPELHLIFK